MPLDIRNRILISLAKFLGENPTESDALTGVLACERWHLDETLSSIVRTQEGSLSLTEEKFNQLMLHCRRSLVTPHFFAHFFGGVDTIEELESAVERFRAASMWLFGNFKFAFRKLATSEAREFEKLIAKTEKVDPREFENRDEWGEIEKIEDEDLPLLGYVSGQAVKDLEFSLEVVRALRRSTGVLKEAYENLGAEKRDKVLRTLQGYGLAFPKRDSGLFERATLTKFAEEVRNVLRPISARLKKARKIGRRNTARYLSLPHMDVYVATSMRRDDDFRSQHEFVLQVFTHPLVSPLKLRYFDPTLSFVDDRITKGLIECLMIRRAKVTIYNGGEEDTLGKDSELAATLAQGKPVIVYVPSVAGNEEKNAKLNRRADLFKVDHPLGLQISVSSGVAHGILVVRSPEECARMLRKILLNDLQFSIVHEGGNFKLIEKETGSVLRVVRDDAQLTHAFWTYFRRTRE
jgi:hypothetical protein